MLQQSVKRRKALFCASTTVRALQWVDGARSHPVSGLASSPSATSSAYSANSFRLSHVHSQGRGRVSSSAMRGARSSGRGEVARPLTPLDAVTDDLASFDADDHSGPAATRMNAQRPPRLSFPRVSPENFYFRQSHLGRFSPEESNVFTTSGSSSRDASCADSSSLPDVDEEVSPSSGGGHGRVALPFCRLCREELEPPTTPRQHVTIANRASHLHHGCREIVLDSLSLLAVRGFPIDSMTAVWARLLYDCDLFPRVRSLVTPAASLIERADALIGHLLLLRDIGILDVSLASSASENELGSTPQHRRRLAFERLEYLGDNAWGNSISDRMMLLFADQRWAYSEDSAGFNAFRDSLEMNVTLSLLYDRLHLAEMLPTSARLSKTVSKGKADVVEALLGELHATVWGMVPMLYGDAPIVEVNGQHEQWQVALVEHCLTEIYDLLVLFHADDLSHSAIPLAKEIAAFHLWQPVKPALSEQKPLTLRRLSSSLTAASSSSTRRENLSVPVKLFWPPPDAPPPSSDSSLASTQTHRAVPEPEDSGREEHDAAGALPLALFGSVTRRRARFTLPATLSLQAAPAPPVPLALMTSPLLSLPLEAVREETVVHPFPYAPDVTRDVFQRHRHAFDALNMLDTSRLLAPVMAVHRRPAWRQWALALVPTVEYAGATEPEPTTSGMRMQSEPAEDAALAPPTPPAAFSDAQPYFRDSRLDVSPQPSASPPLPSTAADAQLRLALANAPPGDLQAEPSREADASSPAEGGDDDVADAVRHHYAPSRYVPSSVKPPLGGVLTERNTCHGLFAFLSGGDAPWDLAPCREADRCGTTLAALRSRAAALRESENEYFPKRLGAYPAQQPAGA